MRLPANAYSAESLAYARAPHTGFPRNPAATALRLWFAANPEASPKEMANLCGVHQATILYLRNGRRRAGPILARKIEQLTRGAVPRTLWSGVRIKPALRNERQMLLIPEPETVYGNMDESDDATVEPKRVEQARLF